MLCAATMMMASCANSKTFKKADGSIVTAKPYGWFQPGDKMDSVNYELCVGNLVWSVAGAGTIVLPVVLTGTQLYEPVSMEGAVPVK